MIPFYAQNEEIKEDEILSNEQRKKEMVQIMIQALENLGYQKSSQNLIKESKIELENTDLNELRVNIINGYWEEASNHLMKLNLSPNSLKEARFLIAEQKYLELLDQKKLPEALIVLRNDLPKYCEDVQKLYKLANLIISRDSEDIKQKTGWLGLGKDSRKQLLSDIQIKCKPENMLESNRLENLLSQALTYQIMNCKYHTNKNNEITNFSLIENHRCECDEIPSEVIENLKEHKDEVWNIKFSPNGKKLASVCKRGTLIIWDFNIDDFKTIIKCKHEKIHLSEVHCMNWNSESNKIVTCSSDKSIKVWKAENGEKLLDLIGHSETPFAAIFHPFQNKIISGGLDNEIIIWTETGTILTKIFHHRITELLMSPNGKHLFCISCSLYKISIIDITTKKEIKRINEKDDILTVSMNNDGSLLLTNVSRKNPEVHLWNLNTYELIMRYSGHSQEKYLIRCCFGGLFDSFIVCGSEDGKIYIWHRNSSKPIKILKEHDKTINAVSWNPLGICVLASASDDNSIKIWTSSDYKQKLKNNKKNTTQMFTKLIKNSINKVYNFFTPSKEEEKKENKDSDIESENNEHSNNEELERSDNE